MPATYRHRQVGWIIVFAICSVLIVTFVAVGSAGTLPVLAIAAMVVGLAGLLLATLTVIVDETHVRLRFGIGVIRRSYPLDDIRTCRIVRNPWYYGIGIRMIPGGWLFNVAGRMAVELERADGSITRIGTDQPQRLLAAIQSATGLTASPGDAEAVLESGGYSAAIIVVPILVAIGVMFYFDMRAPRVFVGVEEFTVKSGLYKTTLPMNEITSVTIVDTLPRISRRTNGFAFAGALRGHFRVDSLGAGTLFLNRDHPPYVILRTARTFVIIGFRNDSLTNELITALMKHSAT